MRQIAFFTTEWNYELIGETLSGVLSYLEQNPDTVVRVFDSYSIDEKLLRDLGGYEIFRLADLKLYDGAIVQTHQIVLRDEADKLGRALRAEGVPTVTIGAPLENFPQVKTDDYSAFHQLTLHLIQDHGARSFWFVKGAEQYDTDLNSEARSRRYGFQNACREMGIPAGNIRFLDGNWKPDTGEQAARMFAESENRPDALVFANDDMALGALGTLRDLGIRVPEDVIVTGFDGIFSASLCTPRLATVERNFADVGFRAMEVLRDVMDGKEVPAVTYNQMRYSLAGTCGCAEESGVETTRIKNRFYRQTRYLRQFYQTQDKLATSLFSAESLEDVMDTVEEHAGIFSDGDLRVYLDERYFRFMSEEDSMKEEDWEQIQQYSGRFMLVADSRRRIARNTDRRVVSIADLQNDLEEFAGQNLPANQRLIRYITLRHGRIILGVMMLRGTSMATEMNLHESIVNEVVLSMKTIRQNMSLNRLNERLNELYVTDSLTGLYNRFGMERFGEPLFRRLTDAGREVEIIFLDVDDMKGINDRYGHEAGDESLRMTADVLRRLSRPGDFLMRYGGDEFVAVGEYAEKDLAGEVRAALEEVKKSRNAPFDLSLSAGRIIHQPGQKADLFSCMQEADWKMYENKKNKKQR